MGKKQFNEAVSRHLEYGGNIFQETYYQMVFDVYCTLVAPLQHLASFSQDVQL